jgi:ubiquinol-cytochrome c reductase cytochrome c subunit
VSAVGIRTLRLRGRGTSLVLVLLGVGVLGLLAGTPVAAGAPAAAPQDAGQGGSAAHGRTLFLRSCAMCHGESGEGTQNGPSLIGVGAAAADFYLQTGRMPLTTEKAQAEGGPRQFSEAQIADLDAYVASLGPGPGIPGVSAGELTSGRELFLQECAGCHGASAVGYTQVGGRTAPSLMNSSPETIAEAIRVGPNTMPQFPENVLDAQQVDDIASYVQDLQHANVRGQGGATIGRLGPVTETLVGFGGVAVLLVVIRLIGKKSSEKRTT